MELIELNVKTREGKGKGVARKLRADKRIPAIVYGGKSEPVKVSCDFLEFDKVIRDHGTTGLFLDLKIEGNGAKKHVVMVKDIQMDVFGQEYLHIDFQEVKMDDEVSVVVPIETVGEAAGVKEGGILQFVRRELEVVCKPADTPETIEVDITELVVGDSLHVNQIKLPEGVSLHQEDAEFTLLTIVPPETGSGEESDEESEEEEAAADA